MADCFHGELPTAGEGASTSGYCSDVWAYDGVDWEPVEAFLPPAGRGYAKMVYDPWTQQMLVWGGVDRIQDHFCPGNAPPRCDELLGFNGIGRRTLSTSTPPIPLVLADEGLTVPSEAALGLNLATRRRAGVGGRALVSDLELRLTQLGPADAGAEHLLGQHRAAGTAGGCARRSAGKGVSPALVAEHAAPGPHTERTRRRLRETPHLLPDRRIAHIVLEA